MVSFASSVASQIGSLIASCNPTNFKSVATELSQVTVLYGSDGEVILLRVCLEQVDLRQGNSRHSQLRLQLLTLVLEKLLELPNFTTLLNQALAQIKPSNQFLPDFVKAVKLSSPRLIRLGLALVEAEDFAARQEGYKILEAEVPRLLENPVPGVTVDLIRSLLIQGRSRKSAVKVDVQKLLEAFPSLQSSEDPVLVLAPLLYDEGNEVDCLRNSSHRSFGGALDLAAMARDIGSEIHAADVMEELGYSCTSSVQHCLEVLSQFPVLSEDEVARILGMVARTQTGLEDRHGSHGTLSATLGNSLQGVGAETGIQAFWNLDVLMEAIQQRAPGLQWAAVVTDLDHDKFFLPDQKAFTILMTLYSMATTEPFPIIPTCGRLWENAEGQLSFLRYATAAPPEVFTFAHAPRTQPPVDGLHGHKSPVGTPNRAWLSLDLLEILCRQAEDGHVAAVRAILEYPLKHCPEVLLLGLAQVKTEWNLVQSEILSFLLPTYLANNPNSSTVLHLLWPLNRDAVLKAMVDVHSKDTSQVSRILDVCQDLKVLSVILENTPFPFAIDLAALASRREYLNLEKWLQDMINVHRDSLFQACLTFLKERTLAEHRPDGPGSMGQRTTINLSVDTTATFFRVLQSNSGKIANKELAEEMSRLWAAALRVNPRLQGVEQQTPSEVFASDIEEEANSYFQKIYVGQLETSDVVEMLKRFSRSSIAREQEIFACMIQSLFDEYRFFNRYPEKELVITAVLFGSLIKHQLVSSITLGIALRCVLDALRKPLDSKMFQFGLKALEQFKDRLAEWPQYCNHILQIAHMREAHPEIVEYIERTLNRLSGQAELIPNGSSSLEQQQAAAIQAMTSSVGLASEAGESGSSAAGEAKAGDRVPAGDSAEKPAGEAQASAASQSKQAASLFAQSQQDKELQQEAIQQVKASHETGLASDQRPPQQLQVQDSSAAQAHAAPSTSEGGLSAPAPMPDKQSHGGKQPAETELQVPSAAVRANSTNGASMEPASGPEKQGQIAGGQAASTATSQPQLQQQPAAQSAAPAKQEMLRSLRGSTGGARPSPSPGFGHALNIETLVAAAEKRESPVQVPTSDLQDKIAFIINNISISNLDGKAKEMQDLLSEEYFPWFAQYMVMKRASIEPNFHELYLKFMDKFGKKNLVKEVQKATYENCKVLLRSELIKSSSEERSLLKNLGSWLGKLTIGRNQALRAKEIDPKSLVIEAYEKGLMIAIIPFTSKILEPCASSLAYQPPNPWTMGILGLLTEIYNLPNLKMNLKFDIEVLFKNLAVDMKEVKPTQLLKGRERVIEGNPDFSNKDLAAVKPQPPPPEPVSTTPALPAQLEPPIPAPAGVHPPAAAAQAQVGAVGAPPAGQPEVEDKPLPLVQADRTALAPAASQPYALPQASLMPNNLLSYLVFNSKLGALTEQLQLPRIVPIALERAIREIISPVVDRAATIACMTTRELVLKDFAMEADETRVLKAAHQMMFSLGGSLAHVTCKEPLRVAFANHLRSLLQAANAGMDVENAVQLLTNDNLDLGCAVIEKATTEKSERDLEETLAQQLALRRKQRETLGAAYYDAQIYSQGNLARLPEALRPKPGRLSPAQQRVYDGFASLSWQNHAAARAQAAAPAQLTAPAAPAPQQAMVGSSAARAAFNAPPGQPGQPPFAMPAQTAGPPAQVVGAGAAESDIERASLPAISTAYSAPTPSTEAPRAAPEGAAAPYATNASLGPEAVTSEPSLSAGASPKGTVQPSPSSNSLDQLSAPEPSLSTGEVIEKYQFIAYKLDMAIPKAGHITYGALPADHEIRALVVETQEVITQCISREEAALAIAQKVFKRLYEPGPNPLHVGTHIAVLESIREVCKRVVKELTNWVMYSDDERKFNKEISVALIQAELLNLTDYNMHLAKLMDGGRNAVASDFAIHLVRTCVIQESVVSATELYNVIEMLGKIARTPGAPEALHQVVELAKNATGPPQGGAGIGKDDKARAAKEKKAPTSRAPAGKEEGKPVVKEIVAPLPPGFREQVMTLFDEWARICDAPGGTEKAYALYMSQIQHSGVLKGDEAADRFFRTLTELAVNHSLATEGSAAGAGQPGGLTYTAVDIYAKLVVLLVKYYVDPTHPNISKINLLNKVLMVTGKLVLRDADDKKMAFNSKPFFRLFVNWLMDFNSADPVLDSSNFQVLTGFASTFQALQPLRVPAFSFAWLELVSHRAFMPKLLLANQQKGWPWFQRLLVALFKFMEPYLRNAELSDPVRLLYKGTLRVLLVLLHDFPEFLCDYHFSFCDVIPPSCIQMRNLILSAFPRNMRLPDPFTPNLKVDLLPEISQPPRILSDVEAALRNKQIKTDIDEYLKTRQPVTFLAADLKQRLLLPQNEAAQYGTGYNVQLMNALVLYIGMQAIQQLQNKSPPQQLAVPTAPITHSAPMDIFQRLIADLDTEGRYLFLNAIANQLRYPNNHTHYFSCVLLYLFAEAQQEIIQEQITRVLLERLIVNRPHPWGLLITFIELIKNPRYNFWSHGFTRCAPEIEKLFESVARSCMGPPPKPEDDLQSGLGSDQLKL